MLPAPMVCHLSPKAAFTSTPAAAPAGISPDWMGMKNIPSELMRVFAATPTQLSSPARASISLSATGVHAIQPLDAQQADCQRVPELASPRRHPKIFGRNFREPHLIKGNRALPPWPLPFPLNAARR
ncbi:hypothetical protein CK807_06965 [Brucella abortus]|nr:hypothetical protein CJP69_05420 [Brucella abortus]ASU74825.1 hypothetical protein CJP70_05540 [Brucella abortus]ASZ95288.1 hypothetical protein CK804_06975 [Brucella abortus]ATA01121.1 hypothetical protein CK808_06940 [Brucella abortus]ATA01122.1 hypothetical protein CK808_06945 [Brucella abortus]